MTSLSLPSQPAAQRPLPTRVVLATVTNPQNEPLVGLGPDDFLIEEDGRPQEVFDVRVADYPVIVLVDDGFDAGEVDAIRKAAARFIARLGDRPVAVGRLTAPAAMVAALEDDRATVIERVEQLAARPGAALAPTAALAEASRLIRQSGARFSAIVALLGRAADPVEADAAAPLASVPGGRTRVHAVGRHPRLSATRGAGQPRTAGGLLYDLADQTGGEYTPVYAAASYGVAMDRLADRLTTEMLIEYVVSAEGGPAADVRVGVRVAGARVRGLGVSR